MSEAANSQDRMRAMLVIVATIATIVFNVLAAAGRINGITPDIISDKYPTVLTPANYAFSIWAFIYLGIAVFSIYQVLGVNLVRFRPVRSLYIFSCLLNCGWIYFWHRDQIFVCTAVIAALLATLTILVMLLKRSISTGGAMFTTLPFGLYAGWVTAAGIINFVIFLKFEGVEFSNAVWNGLGVVLIIFAAVLAVVVRWRLKNYLYPLAIAWALTAIAIKQGNNTAIVVAAALGVVICLVTAGSFVVNLKDSTSE